MIFNNKIKNNLLKKGSKFINTDSYKKIIEQKIQVSLFNYAPAVGTILVGLSGGGDSLALLILLKYLSSEWGWRIVVGHVDHGLRYTSKIDARYISFLSTRLGVEFLIQRVIIKSDNSLSLEQAAREARRVALVNMANQVGAKIIALAHTLDDQAETLIMRMVIGTGLTGLVGLRVWSPPWWRPLLNLGREEIRLYLKSRNQFWLEDSSNLEMRPLRNRIRWWILPQIKKIINPQVVNSLNKLAKIILYEEEYWKAWCCWAILYHGREEGTSLCLEADWLAQQELVGQRRLIRYLADKITGQGQHLLFKHIKQILKLNIGRYGRQLVLPQGMKVYREQVFLRLDKNELNPNFLIKIDGPSWVWLPQLYLWLAIEQGIEPKHIKARGSVVWLPLDLIRWPLIIRPPNSGDFFRPLGAPGKKRLNRFFLDLKVPLWWRKRTVIITDRDGNFLWVAPWSVAERSRAEGGPWLNFRLINMINI